MFLKMLIFICNSTILAVKNLKPDILAYFSLLVRILGIKA